MKRNQNVKIDQTAIFKRDTQGMTNSQKFEYLGMSDVEKAKFVASIRPQNIENIKEKDIKTKPPQPSVYV